MSKRVTKKVVPVRPVLTVREKILAHAQSVTPRPPKTLKLRGFGR